LSFLQEIVHWKPIVSGTGSRVRTIQGVHAFFRILPKKLSPYVIIMNNIPESDIMAEEKKEEKKSFWETLPGILTALALVITAIGGLATGLANAGFFEKTSSSPALDNSSIARINESTPVTLSSFTVTAYPSSVRRGNEVRLFFSRPIREPAVNLNGDLLPVKVFENYVIVTVPANAVSGSFEVVSLADREKATVDITVLPDPITP
jgi:hypothetical protein